MKGLSASTQALIALRCLVSFNLLLHGITRVMGDGYVAGFGQFLAGSGIPAGAAVAWGITVFELIGTPLLALGWQQRWIALGFAAELATGIAMVHAKEGWFVVGDGRNGAEYSVVLIAILLAVAWARPAAATPAFDPASATM